jgi:RNA polymerase sigma-B factor
MHVSRPTKDLIPRLRDTTETLTVELGRSPTPAELAQSLDVGVDTVLEALEARGAYRAMSLNSPPEYADRAVDVSLATIDHGIVSVVDRLTVERLLSRLPARERRIVELRFFSEMTQSEIAAQIGISQMHVSRLLRKALERLDDLDGEVA